jgi:hypothetical protein
VVKRFDALNLCPLFILPFPSGQSGRGTNQGFDRARRLGDGAGSQGFGSGAVVVVIEHRREAGAQVPFEVMGQNAEEDVGAHARAETVKDGADVKIDGLEPAEGALDPAEALVGRDGGGVDQPFARVIGRGDGGHVALVEQLELQGAGLDQTADCRSPQGGGPFEPVRAQFGVDASLRHHATVPTRTTWRRAKRSFSLATFRLEGHAELAELIGGGKEFAEVVATAGDKPKFPVPRRRQGGQSAGRAQIWKPCSACCAGRAKNTI